MVSWNVQHHSTLLLVEAKCLVCLCYSRRACYSCRTLAWLTIPVWTDHWGRNERSISILKKSAMAVLLSCKRAGNLIREPAECPFRKKPSTAGKFEHNLGSEMSRWYKCISCFQRLWRDCPWTKCTQAWENSVRGGSTVARQGMGWNWHCTCW